MNNFLSKTGLTVLICITGCVVTYGYWSGMSRSDNQGLIVFSSESQLEIGEFRIPKEHLHVDLGELLISHGRLKKGLKLAIPLSNQASTPQTFALVGKSCNCLTTDEHFTIDGRSRDSLELVITPKRKHGFVRHFIQFENEATGEPMIVEITCSIIPTCMIDLEDDKSGEEIEYFVDPDQSAQHLGHLYLTSPQMKEPVSDDYSLSSRLDGIEFDMGAASSGNYFSDFVTSYKIPIVMKTRDKSFEKFFFRQGSEYIDANVKASMVDEEVSESYSIAYHREVVQQPNSVFLTPKNPAFHSGQLTLSSDTPFRVLDVIFDDSVLNVDAVKPNSEGLTHEYVVGLVADKKTLNDFSVVKVEFILSHPDQRRLVSRVFIKD